MNLIEHQTWRTRAVMVNHSWWLRTVAVVLVCLLVATVQAAPLRGDERSPSPAASEDIASHADPAGLTELPQKWPYQRDLYAWLSTIKLSDVTLKRADLRWDGTYAGTREIEDLWVEIGQGATLRVTDIISAEDRWFVMDDGRGGGIEGSEEVIHIRWGSNAAYWYQRHVPMAGGGEGNPYYKQPAMARRALIMTAVDIMMVDERHEWGVNDDPRFLGGSMNGWAYTYLHTKEVLPASVQQAFEVGFGRMLDKLLAWGPNRNTPNMQTRVISAAAQLYMATDDAVLKDKALRTAKLYLFGYENGALVTRHDDDHEGDDVGEEALFYRAGYIQEGGGPETSYNGISLYHLLEARTATLAEGGWNFLDEPIRRMLRFKVYQYLNEPYSPITGKISTTSPSGYAGRTAKGYHQDQRSDLWREMAAADLYEEGHPLTMSTWDGAYMIVEENLMVNRISNSLGGINAEGFGKEKVLVPVRFNMDHDHHWPFEPPYHSRPGWYDRLRNLALVQDDPSMYSPYRREGFTFSETFPATNEGTPDFWTYKASDQQGSRAQMWGFFVETRADGGGYGDGRPGSLQSFWTETTGSLILARNAVTGKDETISDYWSFIDQSPSNHVWGKDDKSQPTAFSSMPNATGVVTHNLDAATPYIEKTVALNPTKQESGNEISGVVEVTSRFEALTNGVRVTHTVKADALTQRNDGITELWATLPVYLRDNHIRTQADLKDTTIEYWDGASWRSMSTALVSTQRIRLGRDFGNGPQYGYITFGSARRVKLSTSVWEVGYQTNDRFRNIHIDMHGTPGTKSAFPPTSTVQYSIVTNPDATQSNYSPTAQFDWSASGLTVQLTDQSSDRDGTISKWSWAFGDGRTSTQRNPTNTYSSAGTYTVTLTVTDDKGATGSLSKSITVGEAAGITDHDIQLRQGWNLISTYVEPAEPGMEAVFADVGDSIELVKDADGDVFSPRFDLNNIGDWDLQQAYSIYATSNITLTIAGSAVAPGTSPINLEPGWNFVAYLRDTSLPIEDALASILSTVVLVKDSAGKSFIPKFGIDEIGSVAPGQGLQVYMAEAATLIYPSGSTMVNQGGITLGRQ